MFWQFFWAEAFFCFLETHFFHLPKGVEFQHTILSTLFVVSSCVAVFWKTLPSQGVDQEVGFFEAWMRQLTSGKIQGTLVFQ